MRTKLLRNGLIASAWLTTAMTGTAVQAGQDVQAPRETRTATQDAPEDVQRALRAAYPGTHIDSIQVSEIPGLYELRMGSNIAYSPSQGRYLLVGHIFDTKTGQDLTQARLPAASAANAARRIEWQSLPQDAAIRWGAPGPSKLAVFTDPDCPYCRKLRDILPSLKGVEIHEFLYPMTELHPQAIAKSRAVWCSPDRAMALDKAMKDQRLPPPAKVCDASAIDRIIAFGKANNFYGTPTLVRGDGAVLAGYRPLEQLQAWIDAGANKPSPGKTHQGQDQ
ncbi:MAG: DsbC family protein [Pseudomonadota bacterium]